MSLPLLPSEKIIDIIGIAVSGRHVPTAERIIHVTPSPIFNLLEIFSISVLKNSHDISIIPNETNNTTTNTNFLQPLFYHNI